MMMEVSVMPNVSLDLPRAGALNRARRKISLTQVDLANKVGFAQGTVSNFFRGKPVRSESAEKILEVLFAETKKAPLRNSEMETVLNVISLAQDYLRGEISDDRRIGGPRDSSWEASDLFVILMALTDAPRLNLTKSFDYRNVEHFKAHVRCVAKGVQYRWVAYHSDALRMEWDEYLKEVEILLKEEVRKLLEEQVHLEPETQRKRRLLAERIRERTKNLKKQLQCHIFRGDPEVLGGSIPFRITVFGGDVCLCSEERAPHTYRHGSQYFVLRPPELGGLKNALGAIFDVCPSIDGAQGTSSEALARKYHNMVRSAFLQTLVGKIG
jgi:transcriptional regulator with XRE-family HTH domain